MTVRVLLLLAAISFSATAFAQSAPPKVGNKPLVQVKPKEPMGCKLVGTVKGTKLWAGDCVASELRGATPATETNPLSEQDIQAIPPAWCAALGCHLGPLPRFIGQRRLTTFIQKRPVLISACPAAGDVSANLAVTSPCARVRDRPSNPSLKTNTHVAFAG